MYDLTCTRAYRKSHLLCKDLLDTVHGKMIYYVRTYYVGAREMSFFVEQSVDCIILLGFSLIQLSIELHLMH